MNPTSFKKEFKFRLLSDGKYYTTYIFTPSESIDRIGYIAKQNGHYICAVDAVKSDSFEWTGYILNKGHVDQTLFADCEILTN